MVFDRSKYKKASVESIDETVGKAAATMAVVLDRAAGPHFLI